MANWCFNSVAFYQDDGGNDMLDAFYADIQKYQNYIVPETCKESDWVGYWLQSSRIDTDTLCSRGFFISCELYSDYVRIDMEAFKNLEKNNISLKGALPIGFYLSLRIEAPKFSSLIDEV